MYLNCQGDLQKAQIEDFPSSHCCFLGMTYDLEEGCFNCLDRKSELVIFLPSKMTAVWELRILGSQGNLHITDKMPEFFLWRLCTSETELSEIIRSRSRPEGQASAGMVIGLFLLHYFLGTRMHHSVHVHYQGGNHREAYLSGRSMGDFDTPDTRHQKIG